MMQATIKASKPCGKCRTNALLPPPTKAIYNFWGLGVSWAPPRMAYWALVSEVLWKVLNVPSRLLLPRQSRRCSQTLAAIRMSAGSRHAEYLQIGNSAEKKDYSELVDRLVSLK